MPRKQDLDLDEYIEQETVNIKKTSPLKIKEIDTSDVEVEVAKDFRNLIGETIYNGKFGEKIKLPRHVYEILRGSGKVYRI